MPCLKESTDFVDIHGRDISVVLDDNGEILVPLDAIKKTGFSIYRKSQYNKLLIDESQFTKEYTLYLLEASKTYMLQNRIKFEEAEMLATINNCKKILIGGEKSPVKNTSFTSNRVFESTSDFNECSIRIKNEPETNLHEINKNKSFSSANSPAARISSPSLQRKTYPTSTSNIVNNNYQKPAEVPEKKSQIELPKQNSAFHLNGTTQNSAKPAISAATEKLLLQRKAALGNGENRIPLRTPKTALLPPKIAPIIPSVELKSDKRKVCVSFIDANNIIWVQDQEYSSTLTDIYCKVTESAEKLQAIPNPETNHFYIAEEEDMWFRCKLLSVNPLKVFFIDYGNVGTVKEVKELEKELHKIPSQAIKVTFETPCQVKLNEEISIIPVKKQENGVYLVKTELLEVPKPKTFFKMPPTSYQLADGIKVVILQEVKGCFILKTRESFTKTKEIETILRNTKTEMVENVDVGQLVLVKKDSASLLQRASVISFNGKLVEIRYLDDGEIGTVSITTIQHITEQLANEPITYITSPPLSALSGRTLSPKSNVVLQHLVAEQCKCFVVLKENNFDLNVNGKSLSQTLLEIENPVAVVADNRIMMKNMKVVKPPIGVDQYICNFSSSEYVTLNSISVLEELASVIVQIEDEKHYEPILGEVCCGQFQDAWYRCAIKEIAGDKYEVLFIDFGNKDLLTKEQLRKLSDDMKDIPVLGIPARLVNLPEIANVDEVIKELISESETYEVNVKSFDGKLYDIEIPSVYDIMKSVL